MPQPSSKLSHKLRKCRLLLLDQLLETPRGPVPAKDIEMTTATKTTGATTTTAAITTIVEVTTITAATTTVATMSTIGRMLIVVMIITTTITPTDDTQEIPKGTIGRKTYARSDGVHPATTREGHAPHEPNHHVHRSNKNVNWYRQAQTKVSPMSIVLTVKSEDIACHNARISKKVSTRPSTLSRGTFNK